MFLTFLTQVAEHYKGERIVERSRCCSPRPYNPQLNRIEGLCGWLKRSVIYNVFFKTVAAIVDAVTEFMKRVNAGPEQTIKRLC